MLARLRIVLQRGTRHALNQIWVTRTERLFWDEIESLMCAFWQSNQACLQERRKLSYAEL